MNRMKFTKLDFRLEAKPGAPAADLYIFDDIGEYEDWDGNLHGFGPKGLVEQLAAIDAPELNVHINSFGGDAYSGIAVMNLLKNCGKKVTTIVEGIAASAASTIAMAGEKVIMRPTSQLMVHNAWTFAIGNAKELRKVADDLDKFMESDNQAFLKKAGDKLTPEKFEELLDNETYLTAREAYDLGLCDEITGEDLDEDEEEADLDPDPVDPQDEDENKPKNEIKPFWFF